MADLELISVRGWQLLRLTTAEISIDLVPALGGTIVSLRRRADQTELLWQTPWGLRERGAMSLPGSSEAVMMDSFAGGWQTLFPNGGASSHVHGVEWAADGEARVAPFDWEQSGSSVILTTRLVRSPFTLTKTVTVSDATVTVTEAVRNVGGEAVETMWGQQVIFGPPLLSTETGIDTSAAIVHPDPEVSQATSYDDILPWPRTLAEDTVINLRSLPPPESYHTWRAYLAEFGRPLVSLTNPQLDLRVDLEWDLEQWPYLWYSLEAGRQSGFPWFHNGYFLALTPSSTWPGRGITDSRRISSTTLWITPEEELTSQLRLTVRSAAQSSR